MLVLVVAAEAMPEAGDPPSLMAKTALVTAEHSTARHSKRKVPLLGCMRPSGTVECELAELNVGARSAC